MKKYIILFLLIPSFIFSNERSPEWSKVRREYLKLHNVCEVCGIKKDLQVHHIKPFHINEELELDYSNLITLCTSKYYGFNCHLIFGHGGNWKYENPYIWEDIQSFHSIIRNNKFDLQTENKIEEQIKFIKKRVKLYHNLYRMK